MLALSLRVGGLSQPQDGKMELALGGNKIVLELDLMLLPGVPGATVELGNPPVTGI